MTAPTQAPQKAAQPAGGKAAPILRPFRIGVQEQDDTQPYDATFTMSTSSPVNVNPPIVVPATTWLNSLDILVEATTSANAATVAFKEDGPFSALGTVTFLDSQNNPICGSATFTGWDLMIVNKWGGYSFADDPRSLPFYSATTGSGSTGGSFVFLLSIPIQIVPRDALGTLPNKSSSTAYRLTLTLATTSSVYSTGPTTPPSVRVRAFPSSYWKSTGTDGNGNAVADAPPAPNTTQYWTKNDYSLNSGSFSQQLDGSIGYPVRNLVFILRDSSLSRAQGESDFPDPFQLQIQGNILLNRNKRVWQSRLYRDYGYGTVGDAANGKDNGVYVLPFNKDFGPKPGWESRRAYLRTTDGQRFAAQGSIGGSGVHTLTVITNYVAMGAGSSLASVVV